MSDVFISYARKDTDFMRRLYEKLSAQQRDVWVDWEDIPSTADWWKEIADGIEAANAFIFIITPNSVRSEICHEEVEYAVSHKKKLIPVLYQEITEPADKSAIHPAISSHNWIYFRDEDDFEASYTKLTTALDTDLTHVREHTRLLMKALEWDRNQRNHSFLLYSAQLQQAETWLGIGLTKHPTPTELQTQYIFASHKNETIRQRNFLGRVLFALVISLVLAVVAIYQSIQAGANAREARALELAAYARAALRNEHDPATALALARHAYESYQPAPSEISGALIQIAYSPGLKRLLEGNTRSITGTAFSPDGQTAITVSADNTLRVWNLANSELIKTIELDALPLNVAHSPSENTAIVGMNDGTLHLYALDTGEEIRGWKAHDDMVLCVAFISDGKRAVSGGLDRKLNVWEVETGELVRSMTSPGVVMDVSLNAAGTRAVTGTGDITISGFDPESDQDRAVRVWSLETGEVLNTFKPGGGFVRAVAFAPDGTWVVGGSRSTSEGLRLKIWDLQTRQVRATLYGHTDIISDVQISPDSRLIASASWDRSVRVYDVRTGIQVQRFEGHDDRILNLSFSPDGQFLLTGTGNIGNNEPELQEDLEFEVAARLWDLEIRAESARLVGHTDPVFSVAFSPDGRLAASGSSSFNGTSTKVYVWDMATGEPLQFFERHIVAVNELAFSPDGNLLAAGAEDKSVRVWDLSTRRERIMGTLNSSILALTFDPTGKYLLASDNVGLIASWNMQTGIVQYYDGHPGRPIEALAFSPDGEIFASGSGDLTIRLWRLGEPHEIRQFRGHRGHVAAIAFSPDGTRLASASGDRTARVWSVETGEQILPTFEELDPLAGVAFPSDDTIVYISRTMSITRMGLNPVGSLQHFDGQIENIRGTKLSVDGKWALSGGDDYLVRLWSVDRSADDALSWVGDNRIASLTCANRLRYQIEPLCEAS